MKVITTFIKANSSHPESSMQYCDFKLIPSLSVRNAHYFFDALEIDSFW